MQNFLAVDTSTHTLSVALQVGDEVRVRHEHAPKRHGELLLPWIEALCRDAGVLVTDLDALFCGVGPGGFTGIRLGVGVMQAIATAQALPVVAVSSLQILAQTVADERQVDRVITAVDARMGEVYWASFVRDSGTGLMQHDIADQLCEPQAVGAPGRGPWLAVGDAWGTYAEVLESCLGGVEFEVWEGAWPHASALLKIGQEALMRDQTITAEQLLPVYLRGESAWKKQEAQSK